MLARFYQILIFLSIGLCLSGCQRQDDPIVPPETDQFTKPFCLEDSPFQTSNLIDRVSFTDIDFLFNYLNQEYQFNVEYLTDLSTIKIDANSQLFAPNLQEYLTEPDENGDTILSSAHVARLKQGVVEYGQISLESEYEHDGVIKELEFDLDKGLDSQDIPLPPGKTEITIEIESKISAPYAGIECGISEPLRELIAEYDSGDINDQTEAAIEELESLIHNITEVITYKFVIYRDQAENMEVTELGNALGLFHDGELSTNNIALSGDYLVVGAPDEDSASAGNFSSLEIQRDLDGSIVNTGAEDSGAVYVYEKSSDDLWELAWMLKAENSQAGDRFGQSVSIDGDLLVVSAPGEDSSAEGVASIYSSQGVYDEDLASIMQNSSLDNLASNSGAVYVYELLRDGSWRNSTYIKPERNGRGASGFDIGFGSKVVIKSYVDSNGAYNWHNLAVAAPKDSEPDNVELTENAGTVYMYRADATKNSLLFSSAINAAVTRAGDRFGSSVALNSQGDIYVGAPFDNNSGRSIINSAELSDYSPVFTRENSGAVYAFSSESYDIKAILKSSNADEGDLFGIRVAAAGDYVAVSASNEDGSGAGFNRDLSSNDVSDSGAVYVYKRNGETGIFFEDLYIKSDHNQAFSNFGNRIAFDGRKLVISHSKLSKNGNDGTGAIYVYSADPVDGTWSNILESTMSGLSQYGSDVAIENDTVALSTESSEQPLILLK